MFTSYIKYLPGSRKYIIPFHPSIHPQISRPCLLKPAPKAFIIPSDPQSPCRFRGLTTRATTPSIFHCNMSFDGEIATTERHDDSSDYAILETSSGSSLRGPQTNLASSSPPYDGRHASHIPSIGLKPRATVQKHPTHGLRILHRRSPRPFQRSSLPVDETRQGIALQPKAEVETEPNAAWKKQMRENRLALNALIEANQERETNAVPNKDGGNEDDLSDFNSQYQAYLGRRGLSNINELTRHMERLFGEL